MQRGLADSLIQISPLYCQPPGCAFVPFREPKVFLWASEDFPLWMIYDAHSFKENSQKVPQKRHGFISLLVAIESSWRNLFSCTVFIAGAHEGHIAVLGQTVPFFFFSSPFSRTIEGCEVFKYWFWAYFCSCLGCRVFPVYPVWSRTSLQFVDKEPAVVAHRPWGWKQKWPCQPWKSP